MEKKINLIDTALSEVKYQLTVFPDGEPHIKFEENAIDRKCSYNVICRICNPNDLFVLMQIGDILNRQGVEFKLTILYLMSMRMDRVISFNESFTLKLVSDTINSMNPSEVFILEPHSEKTMKLINNSKYLQIKDYLRTQIDFSKVTLCYPDKGAFERYSMNDELTNVIYLEKTRDLTNNGQITNLKISSLPNTVKDTILVVDDLCDGGRTFVETAQLLRKTCPDRKLLINVTHAVNESGLLKLTEYYNGVYITNSYKDWQKGHNFKNKVKIYNILDNTIMSI